MGDVDIRYNDDYTFHGAPAVFLPSFFSAKKRRRHGLYSQLTGQSNITAKTSVAVLTAIIGFLIEPIFYQSIAS